jgi:maltooligosyltrehalose synthase
VVAFGRGEGAERLVAVVPTRLGLIEGAPTESRLWGGAALPLPEGWPSRWTCALSGRSVAAGAGGLSLAEVFHVLPVALLLAEPGA